MYIKAGLKNQLFYLHKFLKVIKYQLGGVILNTYVNIIEKNLNFLGSMSNFKVKPKYIVIHHTGTTVLQDVETIHNYHKSLGWAGIGYHLYVRKNGKIYAGRPLEKVGCHAAIYNSDSYGICFEGNFEIEKMSQSQFDAGVEAINYLASRTHEVFPFIRRHCDLMSTDCPGINFPFTEMRKLVKVTTISIDGIPKGDDDIMINYLKNNPVVSGSNGMNVYVLQALLTQAGYNVNGIDGNCGPGCLAAIRKYQADHGLAVDGSFGPASWKKLLGV